MPERLHHETLYRGVEPLAKLAAMPVALCGAGAVGSNLAEHLARLGARSLSVIDDDRVEPHNLSTQTYGESDIGLFKVDALRNRLFRSLGCEVTTVRKRLEPANARKLLAGGALVIDGFDNSESRQSVQDAVRAAGAPCLHVGLAADYAEIVWDEHYRVPRDTGHDLCDYPLARTVAQLATTVAAEVVLRWLETGDRRSWTITLRDFAIRPMSPT